MALLTSLRALGKYERFGVALRQFNQSFGRTSVEDSISEIGKRYGVMGTPHFLLVKEGRKLGKMSEFRVESYWASVVREHA